jgi:hypothetical protein
MAAYVEAVRYRAAWLAEPEAFKPPKDVLERARAAVVPAPVDPQASAHRPLGQAKTDRRLAAAGLLAAACLVAVLVLRPGAPRPGTRVPLPMPVAQALADRTHLGSGLFLPGAESVRTQSAKHLRGRAESGVAGEPGALVTSHVVDSLRDAYALAKGVRARTRAGYGLATALFARGETTAARDTVEDLLEQSPGDCACRALAAQLEFGRSPHAAEQHLRSAIAAGCHDDITRIDLAIVEAAQGDSANARETLEQFEHRDDALGDRARRELAHQNTP